MAIQRLNETLVLRNNQIQELKRLLNVRSEAIDKIKASSGTGGSNFNGISEILKSLKLTEENMQAYSNNTDLKNYLTQLDRDLGRVKSNPNGSLQELESIIETWILGLPNASPLRRKVESGDLKRKDEENYKSME